MRSTLRNLFRNTALGLSLLAATATRANNVQITNASLTGNNGSAGYCAVQFDLSWQNSWRGGGVTNWDAAWVFIKYRTTSGEWRHGHLDNMGHIAPAGSQIDTGLLSPGVPFNATTNPVMGCFIRRSADGTGTFTAAGVLLRCLYGSAGLNFNNILEVRVFAIEMVYVPQGDFAAGDGGGGSGQFTLTTISTATATAAPTGMGSLGGMSGGYPEGQTPPASASWPNGFGAFYCMKYEVTQQGYVDLLNTLSIAQQVGRTPSSPYSAVGTGAMSSTNANRNGIDIQTPANLSGTPALYACNLNGNGAYGDATDGKDIACNFMKWGDLTAYQCWSGLRPMTELEFEKACRGALSPVPEEHPYGTASYPYSPYALSNGGAANEGIAGSYDALLGNTAWNGTVPGGGAVNGPLRVGIFSANASNSGRITAGASYYGIMELSGNVLERAVSIVSGGTYSGSHGTGVLGETGDANVATWPAAATGAGAGFRGGSWVDNRFSLQVSNRQYASTSSGSRESNYGGRGVRSAP